MTAFEQQVAEALAPILARNLQVRLSGLPGDVKVTFGAEVWMLVAAAIVAADHVHDEPDPAAAQEAALAALRGET